MSGLDRGDIAGVVLAAGLGSRMRPLTDVTPKPLLTVGRRSLLEHALHRAGALTDSLAVNAHHLPHQIWAAATDLHPDIEVSQEKELLGTAGALGRLKPWVAGRPVLVVNSDVWLDAPIEHFLDDWDGARPRLLVCDIGRPSDFGTYRFVGVSAVPADTARRLPDAPCGLYAAVWRDAWAADDLEFVEFTGAAFDCGTPAEFLTANLRCVGARTVIAADALVEGRVDLSVLLAGARVSAGEELIGAIRDRFGHTVFADVEAIGRP